jgi:hypothetical protein
VDVNPGDRLNTCKGLMAPVGLTKARGEIKIMHKCCNCGQKKLNKIQPDDAPDLITELSTRPIA